MIRRLLRPSLVALASLPLVLLPPPSDAATKWPPCDMIGIVTYRLDGHSTCPLPEYNVGRTITALDCETGAIKSGGGACNSLPPAMWAYFGGFPVGGPDEGCHSSPPGPVFVNTCFPEDLPKCNQCPCDEATESLAHAQQAGEMVTRLGGHPSLAIGDLLETHAHDIGQILRETLLAEHNALSLYTGLLKLVEGKSVALEEYARSLIEQEEAHIDEIDKMLRKPGDTAISKEARDLD